MLAYSVLNCNDHFDHIHRDPNGQLVCGDHTQKPPVVIHDKKATCKRQ